jgi:hypothetical protein
MCDPITLGTLAIGAAGTAVNVVGKANAAKQQKNEYNNWVAYQDKHRKLEEQRQEGMRAKAAAAADQATDTVGAENQADVQAEEEARLRDAYAQDSGLAPTSDAPVSNADSAILSGQQSGGEVFQTDMARALSDATASASKRLGALATMRSYGGSSGGLGTVMPIAQQAAGADINQQNNFRRGSLNAYQFAQAVEPVQVSYSNPVADIAQSFLGAGMAGMGKAAAGGTISSGLSDMFSKVVAPSLKATTADPWSGIPFATSGQNARTF